MSQALPSFQELTIIISTVNTVAQRGEFVSDDRWVGGRVRIKTREASILLRLRVLPSGWLCPREHSHQGLTMHPTTAIRREASFSMVFLRRQEMSFSQFLDRIPYLFASNWQELAICHSSIDPFSQSEDVSYQPWPKWPDQIHGHGRECRGSYY